MNTNAINEGTDKVLFLRWLVDQSVIRRCLTDSELNAICTKWIKHKIQLAADQQKRRTA